MICPDEDCGYESSEQGVKIHYGRSHDGTIGGVIVECDNCGSSVRKDEYRLERSESLFCDKDCRAEYASEHWTGEDAGGWCGGLIDVSCSICDETIRRKPYHVDQWEDHVCSHECLAKLHQKKQSGEDSVWYGVTGSDHPAWLGGHGRSVYDDHRWYRVRPNVIDRDDGSCVECGSKDNLHVHHLTPISRGGDKYNMDNLITLCASCHRTAHSNEDESGLIEV